MENSKPVKTRLIKFARMILLVEVSYLILLNLALQLPLTQTLINKIKPEKFNLSWESAWTWYPFRVNVRGAKANGQARSQQWAFEADAVTASIDLVPLIFKRVWIDDVEVSDVRYFQRPRLKEDKDYSAIIDFFPPISGREINPAVTTSKKKKRAWYVDIEGIQLDGVYDYWVRNFKGRAKGSLEADLSVVSRGGLFSLDIPKVNLQLDQHYINGSLEVLRHGSINGELGLAPMFPKENKGLKMLPYFQLDADIEVDMNSLEFIEVLTRNFSAISIDGSGLVSGHLNLAEGKVLEHTDLHIDADDIDVNLFSHNIRGDGEIEIKLSPESNDMLDLNVSYDDLVVVHDNDKEPLLTGVGLDLFLRLGSYLNSLGDGDDSKKSISIDIDGLEVPDLALFQRYLPEKWPFRLFGGNGALNGNLSLSGDAVNVDLQLSSEAAEIGADQYRFSSNLDAALMMDNPSMRKSRTNVSGSYIRLSGASIVRDGENDSRPWQADLSIENGSFSLFDAHDKQDKDSNFDLFRMLGQTKGNQMLNHAQGSLEIQSSVSSLAWIGVLLNEEYRSSTSGSGRVSALINFKEGMPAEGTDVKISSEALVVTILDYVARGEGEVLFQVEEGGEAPVWLLRVDLSGGTLKRLGEDSEHIKDVDLSLTAHIEDMSFAQQDRQFELEFKIPSARLDDMSVFNRYFPVDSPLQMTSGSADIEVDIVLKHDDADGFISLDARDMQAIVDTQAISADFSARVLLSGGSPSDMNFDISGTELRLDKVKVLGENQSFNEKDWSAVLKLTRADTTWRTPLLLKSEAEFEITDSRPIVAVLGNQKDRPQWVSNMLTIEDIEGKVELEVRNGKIIIPYAFINSDNIDFGAKGVIDKELRNGIIYARYKLLDLVVKISDGKKNMDLFGSKNKFKEYQVDQ